MIRHFLTLNDVSAAELRGLLRGARRCKRRRTYGERALAGRTVALVFQKPSMRTRVAFEVAVLQLGGSVVYLGQDDIQLGQREPVKDVARVLSRYVDAIVIRTFGHHDAEEFAACSRVPVINGLSDLHHPCQALADLLTIEEHCGRLAGVRVGYVGDGNNVLNSLVQGAGRLGMRLQVATPRGYAPDAAIWRQASRAGRAVLSHSTDPLRAARGADVLYTDVWTSMGQERERAARRKAFREFQVNGVLLAQAKPRCGVMHCLPAHRGEEITDAVLEGDRSLVFDQAENRLHAQKALLMFLLGRSVAQ